MSDLVHRLLNHEVHAVHDFDDDCAEAAKEIVRLRGLLKEIDSEIYQSSRGDIRSIAQEGFSK